jgi:recombinational DNA repair protein (RecF pathway)
MHPFTESVTTDFRRIIALTAFNERHQEELTRFVDFSTMNISGFKLTFRHCWNSLRTVENVKALYNILTMTNMISVRLSEGLRSTVSLIDGHA